MITDGSVNLIHVVTHPVRYKILKLFQAEGTELFISQIAEKIGINNRLASFHLGALLQHGLVEGQWQVSKVPRSKGKAVKYYKITTKASTVLTQCGL